MKLHLLNLLAPDYCYSCQKIGAILCQSCIYDISSEAFGRCLRCLMPTTGDNLCQSCKGLYQQAWVVGERSGVLERIVNDSKFAANRRACLMQATLLSSVIPRLPTTSLVVPLPTIWPHQRQRGYGHAEYIAQAFAGRRGLNYQLALKRLTNSVQHGASRQERFRQADLAFTCPSKLISDAPVLLVDDVYTTGASIEAATRVLRQAGASDVWVAVTSRQVLDE